MSDENQDQPQASDKPAKKPYTKPKLVDYGSVAAITLGSLQKQSDAGSGQAMT